MTPLNFNTLKNQLRQLSTLERVIIGVLLVVVWLLFSFLPVTYKDWVDAFRPAALNWWNPYFEPEMIFNPPWLFPVLYPVALLPAKLGAGLLMTMSMIVLAAYVGSPKKMLVVIIAAPISTMFALGQLDALLLLALMLPAEWALPVMVIKPQGMFLAALRRITKKSLIVFAAVLGVSVLVWGFWWTNLFGTHPNQTVNASFFPYTIALGIPLLVLGWQKQSDAMLCAASLCFAPYFMITSTLPAIAALVKETEDWRWWLGVIAASWIHLLMTRGFFG